MNRATSSFSVLVGFDGFIDYIYKPIRKRQGSDSINVMQYKHEFIEALEASTAHVELNSRLTAVGGNSPIAACMLSQMGLNVDLIGFFGSKKWHPLFKSIKVKMRSMHSLGDHATTRALEFLDSKIYLGELELLPKITFGDVMKTIGLLNLRTMLDRSDALYLANWSMIHNMPHILSGLLDIKIEHRQRFLFADFADPHKRSKSDVLSWLNILSKATSDYCVILGLNNGEESFLYDCLGWSGLDRSAERLQDVYKLHAVFIHSPKQHIYIDVNGQRYERLTSYNSSPKFLTGAGDRLSGCMLYYIMSGKGPMEMLELVDQKVSFYSKNGYMQAQC